MATFVEDLKVQLSKQEMRVPKNSCAFPLSLQNCLSGSRGTQKNVCGNSPDGGGDGPSAPEELGGELRYSFWLAQVPAMARETEARATSI